MYEDLVKSLKICGTSALINEKCIAFHDGCCEAEPVCMYELMRQAADAIESLSSLVDHYGGETGIKNLEEYANKYWEIVKNEKVGEQYNKEYAEEYCNAHPFL